MNAGHKRKIFRTLYMSGEILQSKPWTGMSNFVRSALALGERALPHFILSIVH